MNRLSQTFKIGLAFLLAVLSTNLLPVYASAMDATGDLPGTYLPVWCQQTGKTWNAVLGDASSGGNPNREPLLDANQVQITVHDATEINEYDDDCTDQYASQSDKPSVPTVSNITKCGVYGSVVLPSNTDTITYSVSPTNPQEGAFTVTANPAKDVELDVTGTNYVLGQNGKATLTGNLGKYTVCEQPTTLVKCESFQLIEATNLDQNGWTLGENASFVEDGMELDVTGNWDSTAITRALSGKLKDLGTGISYAPEDQYLGLHVKTSAGTLTYEKFYENQDPANAGKWWSNSNFNVASGQGYTTFDTLENIVAANPSVTLENLRVLYTHPNVSSTTVTSVKIGCKEYTFDYERLAQPCTVKSNTHRDVWSYDGDTYPVADDYKVAGVNVTNNATYTFTNEGLHVSTPSKPDYVFGLFDGGNTALADIDAMGYNTFRKEMSAGYENTLPAYILYVDVNGDAADGETFFWYEPYYNSTVVEGSWQTWDAISGGNAKWYVSGTGQTLRSWSYLVANNPDAKVLAYGFNQGTSNAETYAIMQDMVFDCATTHFAAPQVLGDDDTTAQPVPVTPTVTVPSAAAVLPAQIAATGANDDQSSMILLAGIVLSAMTYFYVLRRQNSYEL